MNIHELAFRVLILLALADSEETGKDELRNRTYSGVGSLNKQELFYEFNQNSS